MTSFRDVLAGLAQLDKSDFDGALRHLLQTAATTMEIARVSYWSLDTEKTKLVCDLLVPSLERGTELSAASFPSYFAALRESRSIVVHDIHVDARTAEFIEPYFKPHGISSMLDVPVWHAGRLCGVICHEHVGPARRWSAEEQDFAGSIADLIAVALAVRAQTSADQRFRLLALATGDVAWELDLVTFGVEWNAETLPGLRYPVGQVGKTLEWWTERVHADDRPRVKASFEKAVAEGSNWCEEYRFRLGDGTFAAFVDRALILRDGNKKATRMLGAMENVTEQKLLKAKLAISDRMASVGTLAAGVAHEINNPLAYIKSNIEFALSELKSPRPSQDELFEVLDEALQGVERVRVIVRDLKHFSRADEAVAQSMAIEPLVDSTLSMSWNEVRHRARMIKECAPTPLVVAHEARLGQVLLNLVVNAAQAIKEGEQDKHRIWVRTRTDSQGWAIIEIEDTGPGIPIELRARVFDPFFTTKPLGVGTGLGLSICHGLVSAMGGEIALLDGAAGGCLVRVRLPPAADSDAPSIASRPGAERPNGPPPRVLVVDDEPLVAKAACRALRSDHHVQWVKSARAALELIDNGAKFDVLLCDVMMPEMTGIDLFLELRRRGDALADRLIFVTGGAFTPNAQKSLEATGVVTLEKPCSREELYAAIQLKLAAPTHFVDSAQTFSASASSSAAGTGFASAQSDRYAPDFPASSGAVAP
jgi:signal transduction histidine kinase/DNA-binding NarL/FixJ family response regulator